MSESKILIVDDEAGVRESLTDILIDEGYLVDSVDSGERALEYFKSEIPDLVFLDVWLPGMDGIDTLTQLKTLSPDTAIIMISGHGTIETAVRATTAGAYDFIEKPLSLERVVLAASRALEQRELKAENTALRQNLTKKNILIGDSPSMKQIRAQIETAARSNSRVLITGESGTGKEIVAHCLHYMSPRASKPFIELNCAAIPQELIESELFGHEKGSFTGAFEQKKGKFELSDGGTLFLDEIGDMSFQTQAKLLRVLESHEFQRVGGSRNIKVDTRVIAATNRDIEAMIEEEKFRSDLFYRLNVIPVHLPPLRQRIEDIPLLVEHFLSLLSEEYGQPRRTIGRQAMEALIQHDWPGNIRELRNLVERLVIMTPPGEIMEAGIPAAAGSSARSYFTERTLKQARDIFERDFIEAKLRENDFNISKTAEAIEVERSNLHRKIKGFGIQIP